MDKKQSNKYTCDDADEPLPLFDCLYCAGIHEHLVLQTVKEKQLCYKYGRTFNPDEKEPECYEEFSKQYNENVAYLGRALTIELMSFGKPVQVQGDDE